MKKHQLLCLMLLLLTACSGEKQSNNQAASEQKNDQSKIEIAATPANDETVVAPADRNQIVALAFASYAGNTLTESDQKVDQILQSCVANELNRQPIFQKRYSLVWGPSVYRFPEADLDDNMMYVVNDQQQPGHVVIAIRGTNGGAALDWLIEDFFVNKTESWAYAKPYNANVRISKATSIGLNALQQMKGAISDSSMLSVRDYLIARIKSDDLKKITVTGHSLAGALAPTFALWLKDTQAEWNSSANLIPIDVLPIAGATPGNVDFANYYDSRLGAVTDRLHNPFDVVPHAWNIASIRQLDSLYVQDGYDIRPTLLEKEVFDFGIELAKDKHYLQINDAQPALSGVINPDAKDSKGDQTYAAQMGWQHRCGYINALGMTRDIYNTNFSCVTAQYCEENPSDSKCLALQQYACNPVPIP